MCAYACVCANVYECVYTGLESRRIWKIVCDINLEKDNFSFHQKYYRSHFEIKKETVISFPNSI